MSSKKEIKCRHCNSKDTIKKGMRKTKLTVISVLFILSSCIYAFAMESGNYKTSVSTLGSSNMSSSNFKNIMFTDFFGNTMNSGNYTANAGFIYTIYIEEEPAAPEEEEGAGDAGAGGGGGGFAPKKEIKAFSVSKSRIKAKLVIGESITKSIIITNTGDAKLSGNIKVVGIEDYVFLPVYSFSLEEGESISIEVNIIAKELGIFTGKIIIEADGIKKEIPIVIEVETEIVLFDVKIDIPTEYTKVVAGETLSTQVTLLSMGLPKKVDVFITYVIKDMEGNVVLREYETVAVDKQLTFTKSFAIPENLKPDEYVVSIEVSYAGSIAIAGELFSIVPKGYVYRSPEEIRQNTTLIIISLLILGTIIFNTYSYILFKKARKKGNI